MTTATSAINWLSTRLGRRDNGGSFIWRDLINRGIFPSWYDGMAWCGATQLDLCVNLGIDYAPFKPADVIYCPYVVRVAKANNLWRPSVQSQPGDWCLMKWDGNMHSDEADHIVMVLHNDPSSAYLTVIGGNHGDGKTNGQRGIFVRTWPRTVVLGTVNRQAAYRGATDAPAAHDVAQAAGVLMTGSTGTQVKTLQAGLLRVFPAYATPIKNNGGADGIFGDATTTVVKDFQRRSGLVADGIVGPATKAALAKNGIKL